MAARKNGGRVGSTIRSSHRNTNLLSLAAAMAAAGLMRSAQAKPANNVQVDHVTHGSAVVRQRGSVTTIRATDGAIIDYKRLDIGPGETVRFIEPSATSRVLNRVENGQASHIDGNFFANGIVYFVNPAGVLFGAGAAVNVGQLFAIAGSMSDSNFINHVDRFTASGEVRNAGAIHADATFLIGQYVENVGSIVAPQGGLVSLQSGNDLMVGSTTSHVFAKVPTAQQSAPKSAGSSGFSMGASDIYAMAVANTGTIKAGNVTLDAHGGSVAAGGTLDASNHSTGAKGGTVHVLGDSVTVSGTIDASGAAGGGTVLIGGDAHGQGVAPTASHTVVTADAAIHSDALATGDGGKVVVWANQTTEFHGAITARAAGTGAGGFVETSGHSLDVTGGKVDASSPHGAPGTWLLDPAFDLTIDDFSGTSAGVTPPTGPGYTTTGPGAGQVDVGQVTTALNGGTSVSITTTTDPAAAGTGMITVVKPIAKTAGGDASLTLTAAGGIEIDAPITSTAGKLGVALQAAGDVALKAAVNTNGGDFASSGVKFTSIAGADITSGKINVSHTGDVIVGGKLTGTQTTVGGSTVAINDNVVADGFNVLSGGNITYDLTAAHSVHANTIFYQAGNGSGSTASVVDNNGVNFIAYRNQAGSGAPGSFSRNQDAAINGLNTDFGGSAPAQLILNSKGGDVHITNSDLASVNHSTLTLNGQNVSIDPSLSLASLNATAGGGAGDLNLPASLTTVSGQTYSGNIKLPSGAVQLKNTGAGDLTFGGPIIDLATLLTLTTPGKVTLGSSVSTQQLTIAAPTTNINGSTVNTTASQSYNAVVLGNDVTLADTVGPITINGALTGPHALNVNTSALTKLGSTVDIAGINITSGPTLLGGGSVKTSGDQAFKTVTLSVPTTFQGMNLNLGHVDAAGHALVLTPGVQIAIAQSLFSNLSAITVNGAGASLGSDFTTPGAQTFGGPLNLTADAKLQGTALSFAGVSGAAAFKPVGSSIAFTGPVNVNSIDATGPVSISGGAGNVEVASAGAQVYHSTVTLNGESTTFSAPSEPTFTGAVQASSKDLTLNFTAPTVVNNTKYANVRNLTVKGPALGLGNMTTAASQTYFSVYTLSGNTTLISNGGGAITFNSAVGQQAPYTLTLSTGGPSTFGGTVNVNKLNVTGGVANINGGSINTAGDQLYANGIALGADATLTGANASINGGSGGQHNLVLNFTGTTDLSGKDFSALASLSVDAAGAGTGTTLGSRISTTNNQTYGNPVTLNASTELDSAGTSFQSTVSGNQPLSLKGPVTFNKLVTVGSIDASDPVTLQTDTITTTGAQTYNGGIIITGNTTLNASTAKISTADGGPNDELFLNLNNIAVDVSGFHVGYLIHNVITKENDIGGPSVQSIPSGDVTVTKNAIVIPDPKHPNFTATFDGIIHGQNFTLTLNVPTVFAPGATFDKLGALTAKNTVTIQNSEVKTSGAQEYAGAVSLSASKTTFTAGELTFDSTVTQVTNKSTDVVLNAPTTFKQNVSVQSLTANKDRKVSVGGGNANAPLTITTKAGQIYGGDFVSTGFVSLTDLSSSAMSFQTVDATGSSQFTVTSSGGQTYGGASSADTFKFAGTTTLTDNGSQPINVQASVTGSKGSDLVVHTDGAATFSKSLTVDSMNLTTKGGQSYGGTFQASGSVALKETASPIQFKANVVGNAGSTLGIVTGGKVTFLSTLTVDTLTVTTKGGQTYAGAFTPSGIVNLTDKSGGITFDSTVNAPAATPVVSSLNTTGPTTFSDNVTVGSLSVTGDVKVGKSGGAPSELFIEAVGSAPGGTLAFSNGIKDVNSPSSTKLHLSTVSQGSGRVTIGGDVTVHSLDFHNPTKDAYNNPANSSKTFALQTTVDGGVTPKSNLFEASIFFNKDALLTLYTFTMSDSQRLSAKGNLTISSPQVTLGDVSAGGNLTIASTHIQLLRGTGSPTRNLVAGNILTLSSVPTDSPEPGANATKAYYAGNPNQSSFLILVRLYLDAGPNAGKLTALRKNNAVVLVAGDAGASGAGPLPGISTAIAGAVSREDPRPAQYASVSGADKQRLLEIDVSARDLDIVEILDALAGGMNYDDTWGTLAGYRQTPETPGSILPLGAASREKITVDRLAAAKAHRMFDKFDQIYLTKDKQPRVNEIREALTTAVDDYKTLNKEDPGAEVDAAAFRKYLLASGPKAAQEYVKAMPALLDMIDDLGLSDLEVRKVEEKLFGIVKQPRGITKFKTMEDIIRDGAKR